MPRTLGASDLRSILRGATFFGSGGGGSLEDGLRLLDNLPDQKAGVELFDPSEMKSGESAVFVAGIGSPKAFQERASFQEAVTAFRAMQKAVGTNGTSLAYLMSGELGGLNTAVPLYVAVLEGLPFVDADGNGRAVPEMTTGLYPIYEIPPVPFVMASSSGDVVVIHPADPGDYNALENIARHVAIAYGMVAAFSTWPVDRAAIESCLVPGAVSLSLAVGEAITSAQSVTDLAARLRQAADATLVTIGKIANVETRTEAGFDFGIASIDSGGHGPDLEIHFKNENMLMKDGSGHVVATVPDIISLVDVEAMRPLSNADIEEGQTVAVFSCRAPQVWYSNPRGYDCWKGILARLGYDGPQVSCV